MSFTTAPARSSWRGRSLALVAMTPVLLAPLLFGPSVAAMEAVPAAPVEQIAAETPADARVEGVAEEAPTGPASETVVSTPTSAPEPPVRLDTSLVAADIPAGGYRDVAIAVSNATVVDARAVADPLLELRLVSPTGAVGVDATDRTVKSVTMSAGGASTGTWVLRLVNRGTSPISASYEVAWREAAVSLGLSTSLSAPSIFLGANPLVNGVGRSDLTIRVRLTNQAGQVVEQTMVPQVPGSTGYRATFDPIAPGDYVVLARMTVDGREYSAVATVRVVAAETVPPTVQFTTQPAAPNALGWFRYNVNARLVGSDNPGGSGVFRLHYRLDGGATQSRFTDDLIVPITGDGEHELAYWAEDAQQNIGATSTRTVRIDTVAPIITVDAPLDGAVLEVDQEVVVDFSCGDALSGLLTCTADVPSGELLPTGTVGTFELDLVAADRAGNITRRTINYTVGTDTAPPLITADTPDAGESGWHTDAVDVALEATDDDGEVASVHWRVSGPDPVGEQSAVGATATVRLSSSGVHRVEYWAVDDSGNEAPAHVTTIRIDRVAPNIVIRSPEADTDRALGSQPGRVEHGAVVRVDFACTDDLSGVASCDGSTNDGSVLPTDQLGENVFTVAAEDEAGNRSERRVTYTVVAPAPRPAAPAPRLAATGVDDAAMLLALGGILLAAGAVAAGIAARSSRTTRNP